MAQQIRSVEMYATGGSVVAGLVPATSRRCCGLISIREICVSASAFLAHADFADSTETFISESCIICVRTYTSLTIIVLMCGDNAIPRVGGRHQAGHYTATKVAYLHRVCPLRLSVDLLFIQPEVEFAPIVRACIGAELPHAQVEPAGVVRGIKT